MAKKNEVIASREFVALKRCGVDHGDHTKIYEVGDTIGDMSPATVESLLAAGAIFEVGDTNASIDPPVGE